MKQPIVIIGIGELAGVFSRGFLRCGHPVYPIIRGMDLVNELQQIPSPELILITVQEHELQAVLKKIPLSLHSKIALLQNELLPKDWENHMLITPTVTVVWFEKKPHLELTNILYSPSYGCNAQLMSNALQAVNVPAPILKDKEQLLYELVRKAVYILTVNIAGLQDNCTVGELWLNHQALAKEIALEVISIQEFLSKTKLPKEKLINGLAEGINDCPDRHCLGRSAFQRLERALHHAKEANTHTPKLLEIYQLHQFKSN